MRVDIQCCLRVRVPKDRQRHPQPFAYFTERRSVGVPETMPSSNRQTKLSARRPQYSTKEILGIERRSVAAGKDECFTVHARRHGTLRQQRLKNRLAHWHAPATTFYLRDPKLSLMHSLAYANRIMSEIDRMPTKGEQLANLLSRVFTDLATGTLRLADTKRNKRPQPSLSGIAVSSLRV